MQLALCEVSYSGVDIIWVDYHRELFLQHSSWPTIYEG